MSDENPGQASRDSWNIKPMPQSKAQLPFKRAFSTAEYGRIAAGFIPREMEDKWFAFLEGEWLYWHRSWTGLCIYAVRLLPIGAGHRVREAWVNRDPAQYRMTDDHYDTELLGYLIDSLLLGKTVPKPVSPLNR